MISSSSRHDLARRKESCIIANVWLECAERGEGGVGGQDAGGGEGGGRAEVEDWRMAGCL